MAKPATVDAAAGLGEPTAQPPAGCPFPDVWRIAHELYEAHQGPAGEPCAGCCEPRPCAGHDLARQGLATAVGETVMMSGYWHALASVRRGLAAVPTTS